MMFFFKSLVFFVMAQAIAVPGPTGPLPVTMSTHELVDPHRLDPYAPTGDAHLRKIMISIFLPTGQPNLSCRIQATPYMTPLTAAAYDTQAVDLGLPNGTFASFTMNLCNTIHCSVKNSASNASAKKPQISYPVILFSPGSGNSRLLYGGMARNLASYGYAVITVDHPYDAPIVEFLDGSVIYGIDIPDDNTTALEESVNVRVADISFLLDDIQQLSSTSLSNGGDTRISYYPFSDLDLGRVAIYGHSLGGATAAAAMLSESRRIHAGVDLDGRFFDPVLDMGLHQPFMLVGRPNHTAEDSTWDTFWAQLSAQGAPRVQLEVEETQHGSFTDAPVLLAAAGLSPSVGGQLGEALGEQFGTIDWTRMQEIVSEMLVAFFQFVLSDEKVVSAVLTEDGDPELPEVEMVRGEL